MNYELTFPYLLYDVEDYELQTSFTVHSQADYDLLDKDRWLKYQDAKEIQEAVNKRLEEMNEEIDADIETQNFEQNTDSGEIQELQPAVESSETQNTSEIFEENAATPIDLGKCIYPVTMVDKDGNSKICGTRKTAEKWLAEGWIPK